MLLAHFVAKAARLVLTASLVLGPRMDCASPSHVESTGRIAAMTPDCHGAKNSTNAPAAPHHSSPVEHHCPVFACTPDFSFTARVVRTGDDRSVAEAPAFESDERYLLPHAPETPPPKA